MAFASDLITNESVTKLKEIHDDIEEREHYRSNQNEQIKTENELTLRENSKNNTLKKSVEVNKMGIGILSQTQNYRSCSERVEKNFN